MAAATPPPAGGRRGFGGTLVRVLLMQIVTLILLWCLQAFYGR